ncbi:hypothetical protein [Mesorhizobium sp. M0571]|uniref:hypothetical protein n=1 Tax=Mesorhizobium sp. M0571 TaxID=2956960 RepID=UPI003336F68A
MPSDFGKVCEFDAALVRNGFDRPHWPLFVEQCFVSEGMAPECNMPCTFTAIPKFWERACLLLGGSDDRESLVTDAIHHPIGIGDCTYRLR